MCSSDLYAIMVEEYKTIIRVEQAGMYVELGGESLRTEQAGMYVEILDVPVVVTGRSYVMIIQ